MNIVISGAGKGIGIQLAKIFSENNHKVIGISRNTNSLNDLKNESIRAISFDLTDGNYNELVTDIISFLPHIDVLINNAGLLVNKTFAEISSSDFDAVFNTNVKAIFRLSQLLLPYFKSNSHIVNISSMGGVMGSSKFPGLSLYSASKGAVSILSECMALELKDKEISVNALAIGAVQTEMLESAFPGYQAPLKANEMAAYIYDFSLNGHKYFNGKVLPVSISTP